MSQHRQRPLPDGGGWRVHPDPGRLPRLTDEGPGRNRYDDPHGFYGVRYVAEELTGALLETMARFRPAPNAESRLAAVVGVDPDELDHHDPTQAVEDWLRAQRVARVTLDEPRPLVDVHDPTLLAALAKHPLVKPPSRAVGSARDGTPPRWTRASSDLVDRSGAPSHRRRAEPSTTGSPTTAASHTGPGSTTRSGAGHCGMTPRS